MGNIEKIVVLTVLFLSAVVLAVALRSDEAGVEAKGPMEGTNAVVSVPATQPASEPESREGSQLVLSSEVEHTPAGFAPAQEAPPTEGAETDRILGSLRGLEPSGIEDYRIYSVREGDTWSELARRFYGSSRLTERLRGANEDLEELLVGRRILVPVYDLAQEAGTREPYEPVDLSPKAPRAPVSGEVYEVQDGDNLSSISAQVFGTATRWEEIYKANRDVLDSPDWLKVGMKLRIPADRKPR